MASLRVNVECLCEDVSSALPLGSPTSYIPSKDLHKHLVSVYPSPSHEYEVSVAEVVPMYRSALDALIEAWEAWWAGDVASVKACHSHIEELLKACMDSTVQANFSFREAQDAFHSTRKDLLSDRLVEEEIFGDSECGDEMRNLQSRMDLAKGAQEAWNVILDFLCCCQTSVQAAVRATCAKAIPLSPRSKEKVMRFLNVARWEEAVPVLCAEEQKWLMAGYVDTCVIPSCLSYSKAQYVKSAALLDGFCAVLRLQNGFIIRVEPSLALNVIHEPGQQLVLCGRNDEEHGPQAITADLGQLFTVRRPVVTGEWFFVGKSLEGVTHLVSVSRKTCSIRAMLVKGGDIHALYLIRIVQTEPGSYEIAYGFQANTGDRRGFTHWPPKVLSKIWLDQKM